MSRQQFKGSKMSKVQSRKAQFKAKLFAATEKALSDSVTAKLSKAQFKASKTVALSSMPPASPLAESLKPTDNTKQVKWPLPNAFAVNDKIPDEQAKAVLTQDGATQKVFVANVAKEAGEKFVMSTISKIKTKPVLDVWEERGSKFHELPLLSVFEMVPDVPCVKVGNSTA